MNRTLSSIPNLSEFSNKNFLVGFLAPALLLTVILTYLLRWIGVVGAVYLKVMQEPGSALNNFAVLAVTVALVANGLVLGYSYLLRVLSGYYGVPFRQVWRLRAARKFAALQEEARIGVHRTSEGLSPTERRRYMTVVHTLAQRYPSRADLVLPTRLGNAIRAFETYADDVYGIDGIAAGPRMQGVIPAPFQGKIEDARARVNLAVNAWFCALVVLLASVASVAADVLSERRGALALEYVQFAGCSAIVLYMSYEGAVRRTILWGELVKSAFDLYLPNLAHQLGYQLPFTSVERREFWGDVSKMFVYRRAMACEDWPQVSNKATATEVTEPPSQPNHEMEPVEPEASDDDEDGNDPRS